jgi:hypothetical protein
MSEEGGTKIRRNRGQPQMSQPDPPMQMPQQPQFQQPPMQMPPQFQQPPPMQMPQYQQPPSQPIEVPQQIQIPSKTSMKPILKKSSFGSSGSNMKTALLVVVIFFMFNSKIFWRQITRLPMMGGFEPSIIALIVNSILAGLVFYFLSKLINK